MNSVEFEDSYLTWLLDQQVRNDSVGLYARTAFTDFEEGNEFPGWAQGDSPPEVMAEVRAALTAGRPAHEIRERPMVLHLR